METGPRRKNKIAFDGGVERRAKNTCFKVLVGMGMVGGAVGQAQGLSCKQLLSLGDAKMISRWKNESAVVKIEVNQETERP